jgi:hypothetical protein
MAADLKICETCPWLRKNHGRPPKEGWYKGWYTERNLRRLWTGLRTGAAPGMICHSTDPNNAEYGGPGKVKAGHLQECGGAVLLVALNLKAVEEGRPQPIQPPMTKGALAEWVWRILTRGGTITVDDRSDEVGVPWQKPGGCTKRAES